MDISGDVVLEVVLGRVGNETDMETVRNRLMERIDWWIDEAEEEE